MADRALTLADEARHLHACLFGGPKGKTGGEIEPVVVARYEAALGPASVCRAAALGLDAEAVEFALRRRGKGGDLTRRMQTLCYLVEVRPGYLRAFVNEEPGRLRAWTALIGATLGCAWKAIKGEYLVRRYGLL